MMSATHAPDNGEVSDRPLTSMAKINADARKFVSKRQRDFIRDVRKWFKKGERADGRPEPPEPGIMYAGRRVKHERWAAAYIMTTLNSWLTDVHQDFRKIRADLESAYVWTLGLPVQHNSSEEL